MKNKGLRFVAGCTMLLSLLALAGCEARCVTCTDCPAGVTLVSEEICEDDFNSKEAYDQQIQLIEGYGCTCSPN